MINVTLINTLSVPPLCLAEHAARMCYQAEIPQLKTDDENVRDFVEEKVFKTGHHTTLQHQHFTFEIDGIAISDVTFGLHLTSPFYNSSQRSGRFCGKMFTNPDYKWIRNYMSHFWPGANIENTLDFIKQGFEIYQNNLTRATELAAQLLRDERPHLNNETIASIAPKIAQEQLRMSISTILPTALDYTINLSSLVALWEAAWTPPMRFVTDKMRECVVSSYPELNFMFNPEKRNPNDWSPYIMTGVIRMLTSPRCEVRHIVDCVNFRDDVGLTQPVDLLHFLPNSMDNAISEISMEVLMSVATMGQDQRHRTIRRGKPLFTGNFYIPPIVQYFPEKEYENLFRLWINLCEQLPRTLHTAVAPYGAMVKYEKCASLNALLHEQAKRLCLCAQEEIYHLSTNLRNGLMENTTCPQRLISALTPPCYRTGKCTEGARYCGRDLNTDKPLLRHV